MKTFFKNKVVAWVAIAALVVALGFGGYGLWYILPKFQDVTVELGTEAVKLTQFMTGIADPAKVSLVSDPSVIDLNKAGKTEITLRHGKKQETVVLHVVDTTAPVVTFKTQLLAPADFDFDPQAFVTEVVDFAETTVTLVETPEIPEDYSDVTVTVEVTDASGNAVRQDCLVQFTWLAQTIVLEYGDQLELGDILIQPEKNGALLSQEEVDKLNEAELGQYVVTSNNGHKTVTCYVTIQDTRGPELVVKNVNRYPGRSCKVKDFVKSVHDASGEVELRLLTELDFNTLGFQTVQIEAEDIYGNITKAEAQLCVSKDYVPPVLPALRDLTVEKHGTPDYLTGVSAWDYVDPNCKVTVDDSAVDVHTAGTYYAVYTATDASLNTVTAKRKIIVEHDEEDLKALVESIAAELPDDPEKIRDYVRKIRYSTSWGGEDPTWYGFTNRNGNCYVHAHCLKALLDEKGYECQIIWVTNKTHYWVVVKLGDVWRHIDATPSDAHMQFSLMTDTQRRSTLGVRDWDRSAWPACE